MPLYTFFFAPKGRYHSCASAEHIIRHLMDMRTEDSLGSATRDALDQLQKDVWARVESDCEDPSCTGPVIASHFELATSIAVEVLSPIVVPEYSALYLRVLQHTTEGGGNSFAYWGNIEDGIWILKTIRSMARWSDWNAGAVRSILGAAQTCLERNNWGNARMHVSNAKILTDMPKEVSEISAVLLDKYLKSQTSELVGGNSATVSLILIAVEKMAFWKGQEMRDIRDGKETRMGPWVPRP